MVLGTGIRGSNFRADHLAGLAKNLEAYEEIGLDVPDLDYCILVTLEHVYDRQDDALNVYGVSHQLLRSVPEVDAHEASFSKKELTESRFDDWSTAQHAIDLLVRANITAQITRDKDPSANPDKYVHQYIEQAPPPTIDGRTPSDFGEPELHLQQAARLPFADHEKAIRYAAAMHAGGDAAAMSGYLYLTARNVVEAYRHGLKLTRGELLLASRQLEHLVHLPPPPFVSAGEWEPYVRTYSALADAIENIGGRFVSGREHKPGQTNLEAALSYADAAQWISEVNEERAIKHWSKAFRSMASKDDLSLSIHLHEAALGFFLRLKSDADRNLYEVLDDTVAFHEFGLARAKALDAYERRAFDEFWDHYNEVERHVEDIPQDEFDIGDLHYRADVIRARDLELDEKFQEAIEAYRLVQSDNVGIQNRISFCEIKAALSEANHALANELTEEAFSDSNFVQASVGVITGTSPHWVELDEEQSIPLAAVDRDAAQSATILTRFVQNNPIPNESYRETVREQLFNI